jgi:hypothetical protein
LTDLSFDSSFLCHLQTKTKVDLSKTDVILINFLVKLMSNSALRPAIFVNLEQECNGQGAMLTGQLHLAPRLRMSGVTLLLPLYATRAWTGRTAIFTLIWSNFYDKSVITRKNTFSPAHSTQIQ